ncbi:hypothetical protein BEH94_05120 [Candidatus Altiarchaeales archaeon WOR_SM1_SCG]|nr:hypothetical protein BEH94_05120 [Candidatus Altiarchaeales archaeon WOR_SM1_SCG]
MKDAARYALDAGFNKDNAIIIVAIAWAESGGNSYACYYNSGKNPSWDRGILQINSYWHSEVTDNDAFNPTTAFQEAFRIYENRGFREWTTHTNGDYTKHLDAAKKAVNQASSTSITPAQSPTEIQPDVSTSASCFGCHTCYSTKEEAQKHVPTHVKDCGYWKCFVWDDNRYNDPEHPWRVIPGSGCELGTGCAHWVAHQLNIKSNPGCSEGYAIRVSQVIAGRREVELKNCKVGDIWTNDGKTHTGIVCQVGTNKLFVEHCSSGDGGLVKTWFSSGKCWTESTESLTKVPPSTEAQPEETPPKEPDKNAIQEVWESIGNIINEIRSWFG